MKIIPPTDITDAILIETNIDDVVSVVWNSGTTYSSGDEVYIATGTKRDIYESLQDTNLNKDPTTETTWWRFRSTTYEEYNAGTTYALDDVVIDNTTHKEYQSLQASNTGNALTDTAWWIERGATNAWRVFDEKVGSQTQRTGSIYYKLEPGLLEGVAFFNVNASTIQVIVTDPTDGEVYNNTLELISTDNVFDGYTYCFNPIINNTSAETTDLPPYGTATVEIIISGATDTSTVSCGEIVVGRVLTFMESVERGADFEIKDFSTKTQDIFGNFSVTERAFSNKTSFDLMLDNSLVQYLKNTLEQYRATPLVCIPTEGNNLAGVLLVYGYYKDARVTLQYHSRSVLTIRWEGLT